MSAAIGVFDSGIGGLSVLRSLINTLPHESFVYLGDTARLPYGNKSPETIARYVKRNIEHLKQLDIKALVIACNSASSVVIQGGLLENQATEYPIFNVIEPAAQLAVQTTKNQKIGVIGTRATISSQVYARAIEKISDKCTLFQRECPLFVPLVEEGWIDDPLTNLVIYRYLQEIIENDIDSLILGCTHYPFLKTAIQKVCGPNIQMIDSAEAVSLQVKMALNDGSLPRSENPRGLWKILTTDNNKLFSHLAKQFMGDIPLPEIEQVDIQ